MLAETTLPIVEKIKLGDRSSITVFGKGPGKKPIDWSLFPPPGRFQVGDWHDHAVLTTLNSPQSGGLGVFCPDLRQFNAKIVKVSDFNSFDWYNNQVRFHYGATGAGMEIPKGKALLLATADCPTVVIHQKSTGRIAACHAGLGELILRDRSVIRQHESVIEPMLQLFNNSDRLDLDIHIVCGIRAANFTHPSDHSTWGAKNRQLINYLRHRYPNSNDRICGGGSTGQIDLRELITAQLAEGGVKSTQVICDNLDTYRDPRLWSHREETENGGNPSGRNLVEVNN